MGRYRFRPKRPLEERLWENVNKTEGCWLWEGATNAYGYGVIGLGGRGDGTALVSRVSYQIHHGPIPDGGKVLHRCDTPACVRPDHLFIGSQRENMADMVKKRRQGFGQFHGMSKLTDDDVLEIRLLGKTGMNQREIGERFGVTDSTVCMILGFKRWKHLVPSI